MDNEWCDDDRSTQKSVRNLSDIVKKKANPWLVTESCNILKDVASLQYERVCFTPSDTDTQEDPDWKSDDHALDWMEEPAIQEQISTVTKTPATLLTNPDDAVSDEPDTFDAELQRFDKKYMYA
jgi:hypothetical protein